MFKRGVARTWFILVVVATASLATQLVTSFDFARDSDTVVLGTVLEVVKLASVPTESLPGPSATRCYECRAQVAIQEVLKDSTGLLSGDKTLSVVYVCRWWVVGDRDSLVSVNAEGDSLYFANFSYPSGADEYNLAVGDSLLFGLDFDGVEFRRGQGGFLWGLDGLSAIREELTRAGSKADRQR